MDTSINIKTLNPIIRLLIEYFRGKSLMGLLFKIEVKRQIVVTMEEQEKNMPRHRNFRWEEVQIQF